MGSRERNALLVRKANRNMETNPIDRSSHPLGRAVGRRAALQGIVTLAGCLILPSLKSGGSGGRVVRTIRLYPNRGSF